MKLKINFVKKAVSCCALLLQLNATGQPLNCTGITVMYATFNDSTGSRPTGIYPVTYTNGTIGAVMGGSTFVITSPGGQKGTASLAACPFTNRFYYMSNMATGGGSKDIYSFDPVTNTRVRIATTPSSLDDYHFVKMAIHPNQYVYAMGVHRSFSSASADQVLIRFSTCGASPTTNCATVQIMGYIPAASIPSLSMYNGDLAFDIFGNLFIAVSKYLSASNTYADSYMYEISAANIPAAPGTGNITCDFKFDLNPVDNLPVNGVAFDAAGRLFVSVQRSTPSSGRISELYEIHNSTSMTQVTTFGAIPANSAISDLASCVFPGGVLTEEAVKLSTSLIHQQINVEWAVQKRDDVAAYEIQRRNKGELFFNTIRQLANQSDQTSYSYKDASVENGGQVYEYRIQLSLASGAKLYSNISTVKTGKSIVPLSIMHQNQGGIQLFTNGNLSGKAGADVYDLSGRILHHTVIVMKQGVTLYHIPGSEKIQPGTYVVRVFAEETKQSIHLMVNYR